MESIADNATLEQAAFFAHEIKNLLAVIKANVQLIELDNNGNNQKSFETIYRCIDKINGLIAENMEYIKGQETQTKSSDINTVIVETVKKYSSIYDRNFSIESRTENTETVCRKELIESLFENLIKNAVEATEDGDSIDIDISTREEKAVITVADSGKGISDKDIAEIGGLFYTTKKGGSGVGLYMSRRIAEQNGGGLKIERNKPRGTKIIVELKLA